MHMHILWHCPIYEITFFIVVLCHFTVCLLEEVLNLYYDVYYVLWLTPKDRWSVNTFYSSLNHKISLQQSTI